MKPLQRHEIARNRQIRREEVTRRSSSSRSMMEYDKWVEGIKSSASNRSPGAWSSRIRPNSKSVQFDRDEEFHWLEKKTDSDTDGASSPILWKKSPPRENPYKKYDRENTFPTTKTQEISVYRKEMMEMVRGLPEGDIELTLQDIVENKKEVKEVEPVDEKSVEESVYDENETKKRKNQKNEASEPGLLIRLFSPLSVAVRRKSFNLKERGEKVAAKEVEEKKKVIETKKNKDEEWWKNNEFSEKGSSKASSVGSTSSSNSSGGDHFTRNTSMKQTKCYCFRPGKSKSSVKLRR